MKIKPGNIVQRRAGFTLAELILSMSVMTIVLTAAATLAFAMSSAESATSEMGAEQSRIRFATMRIRELARNSCMVFTHSNTGVVFWGDSNSDGVINGNEITWLWTDEAYGRGTNVVITEFSDVTLAVGKRDLKYYSGLDVLAGKSDEISTTIIDGCSSVSISLRRDVTTVSISIDEEGVSKDYQICAKIMGSADYLVTSSNSDLVSGDDDL